MTEPTVQENAQKEMLDNINESNQITAIAETEDNAIEDSLETKTNSKKEKNVQKKTQKKKKRSILFSSKSYLLLTILGIFCIGLGAGIAVFEISEYKIADYQTTPVDSSLPQLETQTTTLEATYDKGKQIKLDATDWWLESCEIRYDNTLDDKIIIDVTAPKDLYTVKLVKQGANYYMLQCKTDDLHILRFALTLAKDGYLPQNYPLATMTLTMSEAQAKNFTLNEERYKSQETEDAYQHYSEQLNDLEETHSQQIQTIEEDYNSRLDALQDNFENERQEYEARLEAVQDSFENERQQYEAQLDEKEDKIITLQQQLDDVRNSLQ